MADPESGGRGAKPRRSSRRLGLPLERLAANGESEGGRSRGMSRKGAAYEGAFEAVLAILVGLGLGWWADSYFGTDPIGLVVGVIVGFGAFVLRLLRLQRLLEGRDDEEDKGSTSGESN